MRRGLALAATVLGLLVVVGGVVPQVLVTLGDRARARAATSSDPTARARAWSDARRWYRMALASPPWRDTVVDAEAALDQEMAAAFESNRTTLAAGTAGVRAHLSWLEQRGWSTDPAVLDRTAEDLLAAWTSTGRLELVQGSTLRTPRADRWFAVASLFDGRPELLERRDPARVAPALPLLLGGRVQASDDPILALAHAESLRRRGDIDGARSVLAPMLAVGQPLAPAAAEAWGLTLLDEGSPTPEGFVEAAHGADEPSARAVLVLQAALLGAPPEEPAWLGGWLVLGDLASRRGDLEGATMAAWGAVEAGMPVWAAPPAQLPALARVDAPGSVHPERIQRVRVALDEARVAAEARGDPQAAYYSSGVAALLVLQARAQLSARNLRAAKGLLDRAARLQPGSPTITAWRGLHAVTAGDDAGALALAEALPEDPQTDDDDDVRAAIRQWTAPAAPPTSPTPAAALRLLLQRPWSPGAPVAFARAHDDAPAELWLALGSPPTDGVDVADALAQAHAWWRVALALDADKVAEVAAERRDRLSEVVLDEPLWTFFARDAFTIQVGTPLPQARPPSEVAP